MKAEKATLATFYGNAEIEFLIQCAKCGHGRCTIVSELGHGSEETGPYGAIELRCDNDECDNEVEIHQS